MDKSSIPAAPSVLRQIIVFFVLAAALSCCMYPLQQLMLKVTRVNFFQEDGFVETLTAVVFLLGGCVGLFGFIRKPRSCARWVSLVILAIGVIGFLDELSFGKRMYDWDAVQIEGVSIDGVHDYLTVTFEYLKDSYSRNDVLPIAAGLVMVVAGVLWKLRARIAGIYQCSRALPLIACCLGFLVLATLIDLEYFMYNDFVFAFEEIFELCAGWALYCAGYAHILEA